MRLLLSLCFAAMGLFLPQGAMAQSHSQINVANSLSQYSTNTRNASITSDIMQRELAGAEVQGLARRPAGATYRIRWVDGTSEVVWIRCVGSPACTKVLKDTQENADGSWADSNGATDTVSPLLGGSGGGLIGGGDVGGGGNPGETCIDIPAGYACTSVGDGPSHCVRYEFDQRVCF